MSGRLIVRQASGASSPLAEAPAASEAELHALLCDHPDVLPVEEFGLAGPLLVLGRETALPSGAVDLLAITRAGDVLVVELKTGPQNADFRRALAQLQDYGSDLWQMSFEVFEATVVRRYLAGAGKGNPALGGKTTLRDLAQVAWPGMPDDEFGRLRDALTAQLRTGALHFVLVAQQLTPSARRTIEYLNATGQVVSYHAVELVRFGGDGLAAYAARTVTTPSWPRPPVGRQASWLGAPRDPGRPRLALRARRRRQDRRRYRRGAGRRRPRDRRRERQP